MDSVEEKRRHKRVPFHSPIHFIVLSSETPEFQRIPSSGEIVDASSAGIGILTSFPLQPGHVLEWDDMHQKGKLHIALVKWSREQDDRCRAGLMFI
jgi:hypothetical protein